MRWNSSDERPASSTGQVLYVRGTSWPAVGLSTPETGKSDSDIVLPVHFGSSCREHVRKSRPHGGLCHDQRLIVSFYHGQIFFSRASPVFRSAISRPSAPLAIYV